MKYCRPAVIEMAQNDAVTKQQTRDLAIKILELLSTILNSVSADYDSVLKQARVVADGVEFLNGAGNVVYKIPVMQESDSNV